MNVNKDNDSTVIPPAKLGITPKQRMLNAYRKIPNDRPAVAPELWYYYPAKMLGVDMIRFLREVPFHQALKNAFETFGCEGWGVAFAGIPNDRVTGSSQERWLDADTIEVRSSQKTPAGELFSAMRYTQHHKHPGQGVPSDFRLVSTAIGARRRGTTTEQDENVVPALSSCVVVLRNSRTIRGAWIPEQLRNSVIAD